MPTVAPMVDPYWVWFICKAGLVVTGFATLYKYLYRPFKKHIIIRSREFYLKVNNIDSELKTNGGSSLRDKVNEILSAVEHLEQRQRNSLQFDLHGIFETDAEGRCIWMNRALLELLERQLDEMTGAGWRSIIDEKDRERVTNEWMNSSRDARDFSVRFRIRTVKNGALHIEARVLKMMGHAGQFLGHMGFVFRADFTFKDHPESCPFRNYFVSDVASRTAGNMASGGQEP